MSLMGDILACRCVSIVGTEKNTGKTECLNYVLRHLPEGASVAVTSIGVDGERADALTGGSKPEIVLPAGVLFATSEKHYAARRLTAEVLDVSEDVTALGRVVTARSLSCGRVMLSGPSTAVSLQRWISSLKRFGVGLTIVDGALSRLSSASPAVAEGMVLATGAALSAGIDSLVRQTAHTVGLICLPGASAEAAAGFGGAGSGVWIMDEAGEVREAGIASTLGNPAAAGALAGDCRAIYVGGALTDRFATALRAGPRRKGLEVVVPDFTKVFLSAGAVRSLREAGISLTVLRRSRLLAVCVNPVAPSGYRLDAERLREALAAAVDVPVYDIMNYEDVA